jgi:adenosylhomocysteine nucleosidase
MIMPGTIGLIAAMTQESQALLHRVEHWKRGRVGQPPVYSFEISGQACLLVTSGMGVKRAREATQLLVDTYAPHLVISFGIAGAVEEDLEIGDVVLPEGYYQFENGVLGERTSLAAWPSPAREAAAEALSIHGRRVYAGTAITTSGAQVDRSQLGDLPHPVLEMETAGIAQVARAHGLPLFSLRAISDGPRAPIPVDLGQVMDEQANLRVGKLLVALLRHPAIIFQAGRMIRNTEIAASSAAISLLAALSKIDE